MSVTNPTNTVRYRLLAFMGYDAYRVGDDGSVWSKWMCVPRAKLGQPGRGNTRVIGRIWHKLKYNWGGDKTRTRPAVHLFRNGKSTRFPVSRLVLLAFRGPCPPGMECCHFPDRDPGNNKLSNLRWDTRSANRLDAKKHGTLHIMRGEENPRAKLTATKVLKIREQHALGMSIRQLSILFNISFESARRIVRRKLWRHI